MNGKQDNENSKMTKEMLNKEGEIDQTSFLHIVPRHPFNVKPLGNALVDDEKDQKSYQISIKNGMGYFASLPHDLILSIFAFLSAQDLARVEQTSSVLRSFASHEPLWREELIKLSGGHLKCWKGSWRSSFIAHSSKKRKRKDSIIDDQYEQTNGNGIQSTSKGTSIYSDILYLPVQLASLPLRQYIPTGKKQEAFKRITRISMKGLNKDEFLQRFAEPSLPCLLTTTTDDQEEDDDTVPRWTIDDLKQLYPHRRIRAEALTMSMDTYSEYAKTCREWEQKRSDWVPDESPFYLFDPTLARKLQNDKRFIVPPLFRSDTKNDKGSIAPEWDLFSLLHDRRPDHVWIIAGPKRSGSGWHVDPNHTSAYNTVLSGSKLWMLLPPHITPPGVYISPDQGTVTAPLSIAEWLTDFWRPCVKQHGSKVGGDGTLIVDVCKPGETIYVPAGWKHLVINLEESVAFTQNFVSPAELPSVLDFLKNKSDQISGFRLRKTSLNGHSQTKGVQGDEDDDISEPELDNLPNGGSVEKEQIYNLFVERLSSFDENLLQLGLDGLHKIEEKRDQMVNSCTLLRNSNIVQRIRKSDRDTSCSTNNLWKTLKTTKSIETDGTKLQQSSMFDIDEEELGELPW